MSVIECDSLEQWREDASAAFGSLLITAPSPGNFKTHGRRIRTGEVSLFDLHTPAHTVERRQRDITPSTAEFGKLSLQLEGECRVTQDGRECVLRPGDLSFYVSQRPYQLHYSDDQHSLVVHFPQSFVHLSPEDVAGVTATRITGDTGLGRVAVPLFEQLAMNFEVLSGPHAGPLLRSALDMLVSVLYSELQPERNDTASGALFRQATDYIDEHIHDPNLRPGVVAEALYVSLRHLHTQFEGHGPTVANYIRYRRLELIRRDLADPRYAEDTIQKIGTRYGLLEASHVSRAFRAEYGESPSAYRARLNK